MIETVIGRLGHGCQPHTYGIAARVYKAPTHNHTPTAHLQSELSINIFVIKLYVIDNVCAVTTNMLRHTAHICKVHAHTYSCILVIMITYAGKHICQVYRSNY